MCVADNLTIAHDGVAIVTSQYLDFFPAFVEGALFRYSVPVAAATGTASVLCTCSF
jgi:hypothetical protein